MIFIYIEYEWFFFSKVVSHSTYLVGFKNSSILFVYSLSGPPDFYKTKLYMCTIFLINLNNIKSKHINQVYKW